MSNIFVFRQPPPGFTTEYFGGGGGKGGTTVQSTQIPPEVLARYNAVNARAEQVAATPFQPYTGEFVAPLNQTQLAGIQATSNASQLAQPYYGAATQQLGQAQQQGQGYLGAATQAALAGGLGVYPGRLETGRYMNPYTESVVGSTLGALGQQFGQQQAQQQAEAIRSGAFGGDRAGLQRQALRGQQALAASQAIAPLYQQGYTQAQNIATQQQQTALQAAQANRAALQGLGTQLAGLGQQGYTQGAGTSAALAGLGAGAQQAGLQGAQAQIAAGTLPQQTQQALDTALYQQFLQERGYPFQTAQFLANIAMGTGALSGNTTTQNQSGGFFSSDPRKKENAEVIGHLNDGQRIYRYNYKDDPEKNTHIGVMADEVLQRGKPGVGLDPDGYLAVNYRDVTDDAAEMSKGLVPSSMGGAVMSPGEFARGGYARGGGDADFGSLVAAQQAIYEGLPFTGKKAGASPGLNIPSEARKITPLSPTPMLQRRQQQDPLSTATNFGKNVVGLKEAGQKVKGWFDKKPAAGVPESQGPQGKGPAGAQTTTTRTADAGGMGNENPMGGGGDDMPKTAAQPPLQAVRQDYAAYEAPQNAQDLGSASQDAMNTMDSGAGFDSLTDLGSFADFGSDTMQMADYAPEMTDFGDFGSWFAKHGGRIDPFACGGVVPRQKAATGKFVTPGYDPEANPADIMDTVVEEGEQSPQQLLSQQKNLEQKVSSNSGGGGGIGSVLGPIATIGSFFLKDGGRVGYAEGGGNRFVTDDERLQQILSSGQKAPSQAPIKYRMDDGTELRGSTMLSGPYSEYGVGLGMGLGGGRFDIDAARGSVPGGPAQYRGMARWSKPFAYGGLVPREHHDGTDGNVVGEGRLVPADLEEILNAPDGRSDLVMRPMPEGTIEKQKFDPALVRSAVESAERMPLEASSNFLATASDKPDRSLPRNLRNNNPGNLEASAWTQKQPGYVGSDGRFAIFETPEHGSKAMDSLLMGYASRGLETPSSIIGRWSPVSDPLNQPGSTSNYASYVAKKLGVGPNDKIDMSNPEVRAQLASAMTEFEGGTQKRDGAPRPPKDIGREEKAPGLTLGRSGPGKFNGVSGRSAGLGDVFSEFLPESVPTSENFWIPAASFLGGMLTSPNRSFLGALGSGLVSTASSQMELDRLNEERAKNVMNYVKDNFTVGTDQSGNPVIYDQFGTPYASTLAAQAAVAQLFLARGLNPETYGIPKQAVDAAKKRIKGEPLPEVAPRTPAPGEKKEVAELPAAEKPAKPAAAPPIEEEELLSMETRQLKDYVVSTPEIMKRYGTEKVPQMNAEIVRLQQAYTDAIRNPKVSEARVSGLQRQADDLIKQRDRILDEATRRLEQAASANTEQAMKAFGEYNKTRDQSYKDRAKTREATDRLATILSRVETNKPTEALDELKQWMGYFGIPYNKEQSSDLASMKKISQDWIYEKLNDQKLTRAPASSQAGLSKTVPGPEMQGPAAKLLLARAKAYLDMGDAYDVEYAHGVDPQTGRKNYGTNPLRFSDKYYARNDVQEKLKERIGYYLTNLPDPKGISREQKKIWQDEFGKYYDPTVAVSGTAPKAEQRQLSAEDSRALDWANRNPNDPRSKQIKQTLGVQ